MIEVLKALSVFFAYAVMAVFAQNAVFTRALGVSRLVKLVDDTTVDSLTFGALLCAVQLISAPLGYFVNLWLAQYPYRMYIRPLVMVLCSTVAFFIVLLVVVVFFRLHGAREIVAVLPMATFNTCILGTLFISTIQSFSLVQTMGFALGSGVGYVLAVQVVTEGQRKLQSDAVPATFRGLPITLLYIGILALAIYGFTGHIVAFLPLLRLPAGECCLGPVRLLRARPCGGGRGFFHERPARRHSGHGGAAAPRERTEKGGLRL